MKALLFVLVLALLPCTGGCTARVDTTEDSTRLEAEVPKVEVGDAPIDMDPRTDDDIDIDTTAPGDN